MTFARVIYLCAIPDVRPEGYRHASFLLFHGHTDATRRQLRAWNAAVKAWRHLEASESGGLPYTVEPTGAALAARSWEFLAGPLVTSPSAVARGF